MMPEMQVYPVITSSGRKGRVFRKARFLDRSETNRIEFDDGEQLQVPPAALSVQSDGTFVLDDVAHPTPPEPATATERPAAPKAPAPEPKAQPRTAASPAAPQPTPAPEPPAAPKPPAPEAKPVRPAVAAHAPPETVKEWHPAPDSAPRGADNSPEQVMQTMAENNEKPASFSDPLFTENVHVENVPVNRIVDGPVSVRQEGDVTIIPVVEEVITIQKRLLLREEVRITRRRSEIREPRRVVLGANEARTLGADGREVHVSE